MKQSRPSDLRNLVDRLIEKAFLGTYIRNKPGEVIKRLSEKDRELCKQLTAEDFDHRI